MSVFQLHEFNYKLPLLLYNYKLPLLFPYLEYLIFSTGHINMSNLLIK